MPAPRTSKSSVHLDGVAALRELAGRGRLAGSGSDPAVRAVLRGAAYDLVWPLVWARHTRWIETTKGHQRCASGFLRLDGACLDGFHDDVEAVVDYLFRHAKEPIGNLEGWITSRIRPAVVDAYRRRRGGRGALQRVRVPDWLRARLGGDPWLEELAARIIEWAGVPTAAGHDLWPLEAWSDLRAAVTGDRTGSRPATVGADLERVLDAMHSGRPSWFADYIERPLGRKQFPVAGTPATDDPLTGSVAASQARAVDADDSRLVALASAAVEAITTGLADGRSPDELVPAVVRATFLGAHPDLVTDAAPHRDTAERERWLASVLADERAVAQIVRRVLGIVGA